MSRTFTKLFSSITESTIWCEPDRTRLVWICMLAMADQHGRVWASVPGLANRARVPLEDAQIALDAFLSPDPYSRTPDNEGRRIEAIDGGWRLLNHEKYRAIRDEESIKESKRRYINARRAEERKSVEQSRTQSNPVELGRANTEAETEAETVNTSAKAASDLPGFARFWAAWPSGERKQARGKCLESWKKAKAEKDADLVIAHVESLKASVTWTKNNGEFVPAPLVYLNNRRWEGVEPAPSQSSSVGFFR